MAVESYHDYGQESTNSLQFGRNSEIDHYRYQNHQYNVEHSKDYQHEVPYLYVNQLDRSLQAEEEKVLAKYDFDGNDAGDLPFQQGEIMTVLSKDEKHWWTARNSLGHTGTIPVPYIKVISNNNDYFEGNDRQVDTRPKVPSILDVGKGVLEGIASGLEQMAKSIRRLSQNEFDPRQDFGFFGFNFANFISSGAWILPTTVFTGGLVFREEIGEAVTSINRQIGNVIDDSPIGNLLDVIFGVSTTTPSTIAAPATASPSTDDAVVTPDTCDPVCPANHQCSGSQCMCGVNPQCADGLLCEGGVCACKVNGNPGDGTEQGTCPDPSQVCNGAGQCIG